MGTLSSVPRVSRTVVTLTRLKREERTSAIILLQVGESSLASWDERGMKKKVA